MRSIWASSPAAIILERCGSGMWGPGSYLALSPSRAAWVAAVRSRTLDQRSRAARRAFSRRRAGSVAAKDLSSACAGQIPVRSLSVGEDLLCDDLTGSGNSYLLVGVSAGQDGYIVSVSSR